MRIFVYKVIFLCFSIFALYQATVGMTIKNIQKKIFSVYDEENLNLIKNKLRKEINKGLEKDRIINKPDAELINRFLKKIIYEINNP